MERGQLGGARAVAALVGVLVVGVVIGAVAVLALGGDRADGASAAVCRGLDARIQREIAAGADVLVFLRPDLEPAQVDAIRARLRDVDGVESMSYTDADAALAEFNELFADEPSVVGSLSSDVLPTSFRLVMAEGADLPESTLDGAYGVYRVVQPPLPSRATVVDAVRHVAVHGDSEPVALAIIEAVDDLEGVAARAEGDLRRDLDLLVRGVERERAALARGENGAVGRDAVAAAERIVLTHASSCRGRR